MCPVRFQSVTSIQRRNLCSSVTSWEDHGNEIKFECRPTGDQCIKFHYKARIGQLFYKGCAEQLLCDNAKNPICNEGVGSDVTCDIWCCDDKDNYNVGSVLHISGFILLSYASASLLVLVLVLVQGGRVLIVFFKTLLAQFAVLKRS